MLCSEVKNSAKVEAASARTHASLVLAYLDAKDFVLQSGYSGEIDWQESMRVDNVTEQYLLREVAWVVLSSGMRESVVRGCFPGITAAFCHWRSATEINQQSRTCRRQALKVFGHQLKINAIIETARRVSTAGFQSVKRRIREDGIEYLRTFSYIGPTTVYHLAKNLGLDVAKPDRHLRRIAHSLGFVTPQSLCSMISDQLDDRIAVVDLVIWRFATLNPNYEEFFRSAVRRKLT